MARVYQSGVCQVPAGHTSVVDRLEVYSNLDTMPELLIDEGASIIVTNYYRVGNVGQYGRVRVKGDLSVIKNNNAGTALGGYDSRFYDSYGEMTVDGGSFSATCGYLYIGSAGTGTVHLINGGSFTNNSHTRIGSGHTPANLGSFVMDSGTWYTGGSLLIADGSDGRGSATVNGGEVTILDELRLRLGEGLFTFNDGTMTIGSYNRELLRVGAGEGSDATFVQNGGTVTTYGLYLMGNGDGKGSGTVFLNGGLMDTVSTDGSWPNLTIGGLSNKLVLAGGTLLGTNSTARTARVGYWNVTPEPNGTLEFRDGVYDFGTSGILYSYSNSVIRVVGPLADINLSWWRHNSAAPQHSILELILTKETGHLSRINAERSDQVNNVPGTLRVGLDGGACMLSTNLFTYFWSAHWNGFDTTYYDPETYYNLDLWTVDKFDPGPGLGEQLNLELKTAALQGALSYPNSSVDCGGEASGYVTVSGVNLSSVGDELPVFLSVTPDAKDINELVTDLQDAGYTNSSVVAYDKIQMSIPVANVTDGSSFFAWDFRDFDGTTNAVVNSISFQNNPDGTIILVQ